MTCPEYGALLLLLFLHLQAKGELMLEAWAAFRKRRYGNISSTISVAVAAFVAVMLQARGTVSIRARISHVQMISCCCVCTRSAGAVAAATADFEAFSEECSIEVESGDRLQFPSSLIADSLRRKEHLHLAFGAYCIPLHRSPYLCG